MTWEELVEILIGFGERVHVVRGDGMDAVSLQLVPVAWFISMKCTGELNIGIYEGDDHRLVGKRSIPLAELTPEFVREEVSKAFAEQVASMLEPEAVKDYLEHLAKQKLAEQRPRFRWDDFP